jgi:hypothetical protein
MRMEFFGRAENLFVPPSVNYFELSLCFLTAQNIGLQEIAHHKSGEVLDMIGISQSKF